MLGLEAKSSALEIGPAAVAQKFPVEEVPGVELNPGLVREHLEHATALRILHRGEKAHPSRRLVGDPVVVVSPGEFQLGVGLVDPVADGVLDTVIDLTGGTRRLPFMLIDVAPPRAVCVHVDAERVSGQTEKIGTEKIVTIDLRRAGR